MAGSNMALPHHGIAGTPHHGENYFNATSGFRSWILTVDHKRIGWMYLMSICLAMFLGGALAMVVRAEHLTPEKTLVSADIYNQAFTLHGAVMVFLVIIPGIPAAIGNFILPVMLGAKDVAFPRINLFSYHLYVVGTVIVLSSLLFGGLDTGWTFYAPYSTVTVTAVSIVVFGAFILGFSSVFTGLNFIVTIHKLRPPEMGWFRMPLLLWALYSTAIIQILATPVLGITLLLLMAERLVGIGIFNPQLGGDPVLYQHFFWFYSHPAVYIMIVPAMGVISELIAVHSHRHIFGYRFIAYSSVAIAIFSFLVWGHHMFASTQSPLLNSVFSALTFSVAIPSAVKVFNWLATLYKGRITLTTPMLYALSFLLLFSIGGLTGLHLGSLATNIHLHDTYFVVAHFHYVMMGSTLIAFLGGIHHWWPKMTGRMYSEFWGRIACGLIFVGVNLTFIPQFVMGQQGMPRRYYNIPQQFEIYHQMSTVGAFIQGVGFLVVAIYLVHSFYRGAKAPANPWGGASLEWQTPSPPPTENFHPAAPKAGDPYDFSDIRYVSSREGYVKEATEGAV